MQRLARAHPCKDGAGLGIGRRIPALFDMRRSWVEGVVSLIIEGDGFEGIGGLLDVGA
jgi:hypothetical protein